MVLSKTLNILVDHKLHTIDMCEQHVFLDQCCNLQNASYTFPSPREFTKVCLARKHQCLILSDGKALIHFQGNIICNQTSRMASFTQEMNLSG